MPLQSVKAIANNLAPLVQEVVCETLWPTRCAICDCPGEVLCAKCKEALPYIDYWKACPRCGSAFGAVQCDLCNPVNLERLGKESLPFSRCFSAVQFCEDTGSLVRIYKDQGERRLASEFSVLMANAMDVPSKDSCVSFIPASAAAFRHRSFDHCELLALNVAKRLKLPLVGLFERPSTKDQRALSAAGRIENLIGRFSLKANVSTPKKVILVDDVFTTGSTLLAASETLSNSGCASVWGLTFARV